MKSFVLHEQCSIMFFVIAIKNVYVESRFLFSVLDEDLSQALKAKFIQGTPPKDRRFSSGRFSQLLADSYISKSNSNPLPLNFANTSFSNLSFSSGVK